MNSGDELGFLTESEYCNHCIELSRRGFRRSEPGGITHESWLLLSKIMQSLRRKGLGTSQLAAQISVSVDELSSYLLGLVVMPVTTSTATTTDTTSPALDGTPTRPRHLHLA